jgi:hypothetical protein
VIDLRFDPRWEKPKARRQYETELHGQDVTVTVVPPGDAEGSRIRSNIKCKTYKYGGSKPKRKRRSSKRKFVRAGKIHPLIQEG